MGFPDGSVVKNPPAKHPMLVWNLGQEDPWWRTWQPTPVFLPQKSHRQRSLVVTIHGVAKNWTRLSYQTTTTKQKYKQSMWKWGTPHFPLGRPHADRSFLLASSPLWPPVSESLTLFLWEHNRFYFLVLSTLPFLSFWLCSVNLRLFLTCSW